MQSPIMLPVSAAAAGVAADTGGSSNPSSGLAKSSASPTMCSSSTTWIEVVAHGSATASGNEWLGVLAF